MLQGVTVVLGNKRCWGLFAYSYETKQNSTPTSHQMQKAMVSRQQTAWTWELDYKESWVPKNWCFWTLVLKKTLERPLDCKEIQPVPPKGNQSWIFIGRTDTEAETLILWPPDAKNWLGRKNPDARKDWRPEEKGMTEDEMAGWHPSLTWGTCVLE